MLEPLLNAISDNSIEMAVLLILKSQDKDLALGSDPLSSTELPLHLAASKGQTAVVKALLEKYPEHINIRDKEGKTALHHAAANGHAGAAKELLKVASPTYEIVSTADNLGLSPLHHAAIKGSDEVTRLLLKAVPTIVSLKTNDGKTAAHCAAEKGQIKVVKLLIEDNLGLISMPDDERKIPLHYATYSGSLEVTAFLLKKGSKGINVSDKKGLTPLHHAVEQEHYKIAGIPAPGQLISVLRLKDKKANDSKIEEWLYKAISLFDSEIKEKPTDPINYVKKGNILYSLDKWEEAIKCYDLAIKHDPTNVKAYLNKGAIYTVLDKKKIALECNNTALKVERKNTDKAKMIEAALLKKQQKEGAYSADLVKKLLDVQLGKKAFAELIDFENEKSLNIDIENLVSKITLYMPLAVALHLSCKKYVSMVIKKPKANDLQIIYNDPTAGDAWNKHDEVRNLINAIMGVNKKGQNAIIDLEQKQLNIDADSGVFAVDNLVVLTLNANTKTLQKAELQQLLSLQQDVHKIRQKHLLIEDVTGWYGDDKLQMLLELSLKAKNITIAPISKFDMKKQLVQNVNDMVDTVKRNGQPAIMPIIMPDDKWASLVIKKLQSDECWQIIYNNPAGDPFAKEKFYSAFTKAIGNKLQNYKILDLQQKQYTAKLQDSGPFAIKNLIILANSDTSTMAISSLQKLLPKTDEINNIRKEHVSLLHENNILVEEISGIHTHTITRIGEVIEDYTP